VNVDDLGALVLHGHLIVAGEFRGVRTEVVGWVDRKTGLKNLFLRVTYVVERHLLRGMELAMISRAFPEPHPDPAPITAAVVKGRWYMFEVVSVNRDKNGIVSAKMEPGVDPVVLESGAPPGPAPQAQGQGDATPNLVILQTSPLPP
jgi:hypothetical protein